MVLEPEIAATIPWSALWAGLSAEDRFARVVEASPTALALIGKSGQIELVNGLAERMFGYDHADLLGKPIEMLLPQRFRHDHVGLRDGYFADISPRMMGAGRSLFGLRKDGTEFLLEIGLNPVAINGEPMVLVAVIDVTGRRQIEREREQQRIDLARSNADLEEFAYAASHDLKAPLRGISHLAQWIEEDIRATASTETLENIGLLNRASLFGRT